MKKLFALLFVTATLTSCGTTSSTEETSTVDSVTVSMDSAYTDTTLCIDTCVMTVDSVK